MASAEVANTWLLGALSVTLVAGVALYRHLISKSSRVAEDEDNGFHVVIVGAGMSGLGTAYYLKQRNIRFTILEKNHELGGTWLTQRFHGVRFDSFHTQTLFSFEPMNCQPMCDGARFHAYLLRVAKKYGLYEHIRFSEAVEEIDFDRSRSMWKVKTAEGEYKAHFVVNANGYYDDKNPHIPDIFKNSAFKGRLAHSFDIDQKKLEVAESDVIMVGSGATAITMIPELVNVARSVTMVQRSPSFVVQANFGQYPLYPTCNWLFHKGLTLPWKIYRVVTCVIAHKFMGMLVRSIDSKRLRRWHTKQIAHYTKWDTETIERHFSPHYNFGEQRPLVSLGFIEALPKVRMYTDTIESVAEDGIVLSSGTKLQADTIVLATGFNINYFKFKVKIDGKEVDMYDHVLRRDMWFEGIPNFCNMVLFARLDSKNYTCFTPLLEHSAVLLAKVIDHMRQQAIPKVEIKPLDSSPQRYYPMSSSYFMRSRDKCFKADPREHQTLGTVWRIIFGYAYNAKDYVFSK